MTKERRNLKWWCYWW